LWTSQSQNHSTKLHKHFIERSIDLRKFARLDVSFSEQPMACAHRSVGAIAIGNGQLMLEPGVAGVA
jgi:hypothetical protein